MPIFPASITKRLRYSTTFAGSTTSGAISNTYVFRANDLFDPDFTGTGHQPMGFDQLMLWYNHFCVISAKIIIVCKNTTGSVPTICLRVDADSTPLTVIDRIVEFGGCVTEDLEVKGAFGANKTLSMSVDIARLMGLSRKTMFADPTLRGTAAASPTELSYFHITMWDTTGVTGSAEFDVILEQVAKFMEPRDVTESLSAKSSDEKSFVSVRLTDDQQSLNVDSLAQSITAQRPGGGLNTVLSGSNTATARRSPFRR